MRRTLAKLALAWFLSFTLAAPTFALWPLVGLVAEVTSSTSMATATVASAVTVGSVLAWLKIKEASNSSNAVHVQIAPDAPRATPSGWTASTGAAGSGGNPTAPSTASSSFSWNGAFGGGTCAGKATAMEASKCALACQQLSCNQTGLAPISCVSGCGSTSEVWAFTYNGSGSFNGSASRVTQCPAGYTASGGNCNLTDNAAVQRPSDGVCEIVRSGNSYSVASNDPDCSAPNSTVVINGSGNGTVTVTGSDGSKVKVETDQTTGKSTITESRANNDGSNTTTVNIVSTSAPVNGIGSGTGATGTNVTGKSTGVVQGQGDQQTTTPASGIGCGGQGQPPCKIDETGTPSTSTLGPAKDDIDAKYSAHTSAIGDVTNKTGADLGFGLSLTWPSGSCTNPVFTIPKAGTITFDFCSKRAPIVAALEWLVLFCTIWIILNIGFAAVERKG